MGVERMDKAGTHVSVPPLLPQVLCTSSPCHHSRRGCRGQDPLADLVAREEAAAAGLS